MKIKLRIIEEKKLKGSTYCIQIQKGFLFWKHWKTLPIPGYTCFYSYNSLEEAKFNLNFFKIGELPRKVIFIDE